MADHYYVAPFVGTGTSDVLDPLNTNDPFRPKGVDEGGVWGAIDLRPDPTVASGWCLVNFELRRTDETGMTFLGDRLDTPVQRSSVNWIRTNLDVDVSGQTVRQSIVTITNAKVTVHPERDGVKRIRLRGIVHEEVVTDGPA